MWAEVRLVPSQHAVARTSVASSAGCSWVRGWASARRAMACSRRSVLPSRHPKCPLVRAWNSFRAGLDLRAYRTGPIPEDLLRALCLVVLEARCAICARPLRGEGAMKAQVGSGRRVWEGCSPPGGGQSRTPAGRLPGVRDREVSGFLGYPTSAGGDSSGYLPGLPCVVRRVLLRMSPSSCLRASASSGRIR